MKTKRVLGQFAWVSGGRLLAALLQALLLIIVARAAGPHEFGIFSASFGLATVVQTGFDLGLATLIIRERAADPKTPVVPAALRLAGYLTVVSGLVSFGILLILGLAFDPVFLLLLPLAVWISAERQADTWLAIPLADGNARINSFNLIIRRVVAVVLYVGLVWVGAAPLLGFAAAIAVASVVSAISIRAKFAGDLVPIPSHVGHRQIIRLAHPYWINSVGTQARNLDSTVVSLVAGPSQAGFYAAAGRTTGPLRLLTTSLASVFLPAAAARDSAGIRKLANVSLLVGAAAAAVYGVLIIASPLVVQILLGDAFVGAVLPLQIVLGGLAFAALASLYGALLQGIGLQMYTAKVAVVTTAVCLAGCVLGSLLAGATGAAIALVCSFFLQALLLLVRLRLWLRPRPVPVCTDPQIERKELREAEDIL